MENENKNKDRCLKLQLFEYVKDVRRQQKYTHRKREIEKKKKKIKPLTHYNEKCGYFLVNFLRNIGIQQTHTIHKVSSLTLKKFNVV